MPNTTGVQGDVVIASNVRIYNDCELLQVSIGAFTHIASGAWLLDVDIGRYCLIGAGSVVTKDVAPYSIIGGVPAKQIKMRFPPKVIARLRKLEWWKYNLTQYDLVWDNIDVALQQFEQLQLDNKLTLYVANQYKVWKEGNEIKAKILDLTSIT